MTAAALRHPRTVLVALLMAAAAAVLALSIRPLGAQLEPGERGIAPIDSSSSYEVAGVLVDVRGPNADAARIGGWREAQRRAWRQLWARTHSADPAAAPRLPDSTLDGLVGGIVVEDEQIGPNRYIARLGVLFDRARTGRLLGGQGQTIRSAPMLVIPIVWEGGRAQSFEGRTEWQRAWARFRAGASPIDYVRPVGTGPDPLLLNVAQAGRRGRGWWRMLLDQYGAADVIVAEASILRHWPGGPVSGRFVAKHGPDGEVITSFDLRVPDGESLPRMLDDAVRRMDDAYILALRDGRLRPDPSLALEEPEEVPDEMLVLEEDPLAELTASLNATGFTIQVETPDAASVDALERSIRAAPGVRSAGVTSLAIGGVSLLRVNFAGDFEGLKAALAPRGLRLEDGGGVLRLRRAAPPAPPPAPAAAPAQ